ncbi:MAG: hypothetical protein HOQ02_10315 [Lysobacter sp.]|nr:hypothetical protein [Lysobacter sp.]
MPVIVGDTGTRSVVVDASRTAAIVSNRPVSAQLDDRRTIESLAQQPRTVGLASPGIQGPKGEPGASAGEPVTSSYTSGEAAPLVRGTPVSKVNGVLRRATSAPAQAGVIGLVFDPSIPPGGAGRVQIAGSMVLTVAEWEGITGAPGGIVAEATHYVDAVGHLVAQAPSAAGEVVAPVGLAVSNTEFLIETGPALRL